MRLSSIFSARNITLFVFILVVLLLGTMFNVHVGHESFQEGDSKKKENSGNNEENSVKKKQTPKQTTKGNVRAK